MTRSANRAQVAARAAGALAVRHYLYPHIEPIACCPECAAVVETFTLTLSAYWQPPVDVERLFRRGAPTGFMRPLHND